MFTIDLPEDIHIRLELLALASGRSPQFYAREAILQYLDEVEERYVALDRNPEEGNGESPADRY